MKQLGGKKKKKKNRSVSRIGSESVKEMKQGSNPHWGNCLNHRIKKLKWTEKQLTCGNLDAKRIRDSLLLPYILQTRTCVP